MKNNKYMVILIMAIFIFGVSCTCAANTNNTSIASIDESEMKSTLIDEIQTREESKIEQENKNKNVKTKADSKILGADESNDKNESKNILTSKDSDNSLGANNNEDRLAATLSYTDLFELIYENGQTTPAEISLKNNYEFRNDYNRVYYGGINVKKNLIIHGNGHTIDGKNLMGHFTLANHATLTIYNLNLINGKRYDNDGEMDNIGNSIAVTPTTKLIAENCNFTNCNGDSGGAILANLNSIVTLTRCTFTNNKVTDAGGAIFGQSSTLTMNNCIFKNNNAATYGGAIYITNTTLTIKGSTFSSNSVDDTGGAILAISCPTITIENSKFNNNIITQDYGQSSAIYFTESGTITITNSNFTNNNVNGYGGAIVATNINKLNILHSTFKNNTANGSGGAIILSNITNSNIQNSDFIENTALSNNYGGGAIFLENGFLTITKSNFINNKVNNANGAAIYSLGKLNIEKSNFEDNTASIGAAIYLDNPNTSTIKNSNFTNNFAQQGGAIFSNAPLEIINSRFNNNIVSGTNVKGGAIYTSSSLNIKNSIFERGLAAFGGAIYLSKPTSATIENSKFINNQAYRAAAIYTLANLIVNNTVFNNNNGTLNNGDSAAIYANQITTLNVINSNFTNNKAYATGGAIRAEKISNVKVINSKFRNNLANVGGAIHLEFCNNINVEYSDFINNSGLTSGGAIYSNDSSLNIYESNFISNSGKMGGSIMTIKGSSFIFKSIFNNNKATLDESANYGGAILVMGSILKINGSEFKDNEAKIYGGAICSLSSSTVNIDNSTFDNNKASQDAGAILSASSTLDIIKSTFNNNKANKEGGAIKTDSTLKIIESTFTNNKAEQYGGAIVAASSTLDIIKSTFDNNKANIDGGAIKTSSIFKTIESTFTNNKAEQYGGAIYSINSPTFEITRSFFDNNYAIAGGATFVYGQNMLMSDNIFNNNLATRQGGAIYQYRGSSSLSVYNTNFTNNHANDKGGAIYSLNATLNVNKGIFNHNDEVGIYANTGLVSNSIFMETIIGGGISESGNTHFTPSNFTIAYISDSTKGDSITLAITESHRFNGTVTVKIGAKTYYVTLQNGAGNRIITDLDVGTYKAILDFPQTGEFFSSYSESNEFIIRYKTVFSIESISDSTVNENINLKVNEVNGYTGTVTVKIGTQSYEFTLNNGIGTKTIKISSPGNYKAEIDFEETSQYTSTHAESNQFSVKYPTKFTFSAIPDCILGETITLNVHEEYGYTGTITIKIGTKTYTINLNKGTGTTTINDLPIGTYKAEIDFEGTSQYTSTHAESNQFSVKYNSTFTIGFIPTTLYKDSITINISESHNLNDTVTITIGSFVDTVELINGVGYKIINPDLDIGTYNVILDYAGSDKFTSCKCQSNEFVIKYYSFSDLNTLIENAGSELNLEHSYVYDKDNDSLFVKGISISKNIKINGKGNIIDGKYLARIFNISNGAQVTLENITLINGKAEDGGAIYVSNGTVLNVLKSNFNENTATGNAGAIYSQGVLNIADSLFKNNKDANGIGIHADEGKITNTTFIENDISGSIEISSDSTLLIGPSFVISDIPNFITGSSITISVSESHGLTGTVVVTIGSESYSIEVKNGIGSKTVIPNLAAGTYKATLTFSKSGKFNSGTAISNQFTVSDNTPPQHVKTTPKLTAKKKTFKQKVKVKKYSVTLKTNKGKAIESVKLTLKVNKKTYSAKTNKKGVATFKIKNLKKKGKVSAVVKFAGNNDYNMISKKVKITVK